MTLARSPVVLMLLVSSLAVAADAGVGDRWAPIRFLVGEWTGTTEGQAGTGTVKRKYEFILGGKFLRETNTSTYPPQPKNKKGEVHEHLGIFSYDRLRQRLVLRQFHVEGFVNQYVIEPVEAGAKRFVFASERFENLAEGWRARESYQVIGPDEFVETFEVAPPGEEFQVYSVNRFKRG